MPVAHRRRPPCDCQWLRGRLGCLAVAQLVSKLLVDDVSTCREAADCFKGCPWPRRGRTGSRRDT